MVLEMQSMLLSFGCSMSPRHVEVLADRCCQQGVLQGCTRHGVRARDDERVFHATFEMPTMVLTEGAVAGKIDNLHGSAERQIVGATPKTGSHHPWMEVMIDRDSVFHPVVIPDDSDDSDSDVGVDDDTWLREWMQRQND